jgi:glycosyltransferase involved in cell wall biosynthesis
MISVLILTYNEDVNIAKCIESLPWRGDVHVLDSQSCDRTVEIATEMGAKVFSRPFVNYAEQRNFGLALPFAHDWIVMLDADERMTAELADEINRRVAGAAEQDVMFQVRRHDMFMGRWLKRASGYPTWFPRIFRRGRVHVEREINEIYMADGIVSQLGGHLDHYPFDKGLEWWFERHNRYSTMEARILSAENLERSWSIGPLFSRNPGTRRSAFKALTYRLPLRPYLIFVYLLIVRGGIWDGRPGFVFASMRLAYEIMIDAKMAYAREAGR